MPLTNHSVAKALAVLSVFLLIAVVGPSLLAQTLSGTTPVAGASAADEWGSSFVWAYLSSQALKWWRSHPTLGGYSDHTARSLQRVIAGLVAFAGGLGISFVFDQSSGTVTIHGLMWGTVLLAVQHWIRQFVFQQFLYHGAIKDKE